MNRNIVPDVTFVVGDRFHVGLDVAPVTLVLMLLLGPDQPGIRIPLYFLTHKVEGKRTQLQKREKELTFWKKPFQTHRLWRSGFFFGRYWQSCLLSRGNVCSFYRFLIQKRHILLFFTRWTPNWNRSTCLKLFFKYMVMKFSIAISCLQLPCHGNQCVVRCCYSLPWRGLISK